MHGHGISHLQTSNQSPETFQSGILAVTRIGKGVYAIKIAFILKLAETADLHMDYSCAQFKNNVWAVRDLNPRPFDYQSNAPPS